MRSYWFALSALVLASPFASAQLPTQNPPKAQLPALPPHEAKLNQALVNWEKTMTAVQTLAAKTVRTTVDRTFQTTETFEGLAKFMKGQGKEMSKASLELQHTQKKGIFEKYLCTGDRLYEWSASDKVIRVHNLPPPKPGQIADDNFLGFLFGMKANEARNRYHMTWVPCPQNNQFYIYIKIESRSASDKADFTQAQLVLTSKDHMPRRLWFHQPNGNEVTWNFPTILAPANLGAADFGLPQLPTGWQWQQVPRANPPRVLRNQQ